MIEMSISFTYKNSLKKPFNCFIKFFEVLETLWHHDTSKILSKNDIRNLNFQQKCLQLTFFLAKHDYKEYGDLHTALTRPRNKQLKAPNNKMPDDHSM